MAILECWAEDVGSPKYRGTPGFRKGDVIHVWPDNKVDGWTNFAAYVAEYPKRLLLKCPDIPLERAERAWKEHWRRAPVPGEVQFDHPDMDEADRYIELGKKRWNFNVDPDNDPEPDNRDRSTRRIELLNEHIVEVYRGGNRAAKLNPWFHDRCKELPETLEDVDDYDVSVELRKDPVKRFLESRKK